MIRRHEIDYLYMVNLRASRPVVEEQKKIASNKSFIVLKRRPVR